MSQLSVILIGFTVPDSDLEVITLRGGALLTQTHNFAWSFVKSLSDNDMNLQLISASPVPNFPKYKKILFKPEKFIQQKISGYKIPFVNILIAKQFTRFISSLIYGIKSCYSKQGNIILVHGVHSPFLAASLCLKFMFNCKIVVIFTDPPGRVLSDDGILTAWLKSIDKMVVKGFISRFDGVIGLTKFIGPDYFSSSNTLVIDGFANSKIKLVDYKEQKELIVLYAGGLEEEYGILNLIHAVKTMENVTLHLLGNGSLTTYIKETSLTSSNIKFFGLVSPKKINTFYEEASVLVNPRPVDNEFVKYSFPSKTIEYMLTGVPFITSRLPSISKEYSPFLYYFDSTDVEGIRSKLKEVQMISFLDRKLKGINARDFILKTRDTQSQGKKIREYIRNLNKEVENV
ncbi:glycosyltransferase [Colwellia sp. BRX10-9]|uniref:glycosyltransferase n=1 Tax=Colwellia sp. BRX10-9 TaxID=2759839 RepID=UPI0015F755EC|nr:glycosyltransferase [Colwellia sp. BRX10-9]MBA6384476.1 glycosyltransferase [Colwellia sp. BRX10-9]